MPGAELLREPEVQPLAVLEEVRVAVLVARAGDERRLLLGEGLGPVERLGDAGQGVAVDDVVARVAAGAEDDGVGEVDGRGGELGREHAGLEVGGQGAVGAEVTGQEHQVVARAEQLRPQLGRGPRQGILRRLAVRGDQRVRDGARAALELGLHGIRGVREEVIAGHEGRRGRHDAVHGRVGIEHAGDFRRRLDETADGKARDRELAGAQRDREPAPYASWLRT